MMIKTLSDVEALLGWTPMISRKDLDILLEVYDCRSQLTRDSGRAWTVLRQIDGDGFISKRRGKHLLI
jgi:hypothetical protein